MTVGELLPLTCPLPSRRAIRTYSMQNCMLGQYYSVDSAPPGVTKSSLDDNLFVEILIDLDPRLQKSPEWLQFHNALQCQIMIDIERMLLA